MEPKIISGIIVEIDGNETRYTQDKYEEIKATLPKHEWRYSAMNAATVKVIGAEDMLHKSLRGME